MELRDEIVARISVKKDRDVMFFTELGAIQRECLRQMCMEYDRRHSKDPPM